MDWQDEGLVLTSRPHGESSAALDVLTPGHGRHAGIVRGGASRKLQPALQPGTTLHLTWRARLEDHMGAFTIEPVKSRSALLSDRLALAALNSITALLHFALPERDPHPLLYHRTQALFDRLESPDDWTPDYLDWEIALLDELGYGLDLTACAVTGTTDDLAYVSPKSGRAVSRGAAGEWAAKLLPLPPCLMGFPPGDRGELLAALGTTGWFLVHKLAHDLGHRPIPDARQRLVDLLAR